MLPVPGAVRTLTMEMIDDSVRVRMEKRGQTF